MESKWTVRERWILAVSILLGAYLVLSIGMRGVRATFFLAEREAEPGSYEYCARRCVNANATSQALCMRTCTSFD